jgi:hypothetical protein
MLGDGLLQKRKDVLDGGHIGSVGGVRQPVSTQAFARCLGNEHHGQPRVSPEVRPTVRCGDLTRRLSVLPSVSAFKIANSTMLRGCERSWWLAEHLFRIAGHAACPIRQLSCSSLRSLPIFSISPQTRRILDHALAYVYQRLVESDHQYKRADAA